MTPKITVMAYPRPAPNFHSTLASMFSADSPGDVTVVLDAENSREAIAYVESSFIRVVQLTREQSEQQKSRVSANRAAFTYLRCLEAAEPDRDLIVCEDDLLFAKGWLKKMQVCSRDAPARSVLCCYNRFEAYSTSAGAVLHPDNQPFWGSLCCWWPAPLVPSLRAYFEQMTRPGEMMPADWLIEQFCREHGVPIYLTTPSLVQHLGDDSILNPTHGIRRSPQFSGG